MLIAILAFIGLLISDSLWSMGVAIVLVGLVCSNVFSILFSFRLGTSAGAIQRGLSLDDYGGVRRRLDYALYGRGLADRFGQVAGLMLLLICMLYIGLISIKTR